MPRLGLLWMNISWNLLLGMTMNGVTGNFSTLFYSRRLHTTLRRPLTQSSMLLQFTCGCLDCAHGFCSSLMLISWDDRGWLCFGCVVLVSVLGPLRFWFGINCARVLCSLVLDVYLWSLCVIFVSLVFIGKIIENSVIYEKLVYYIWGVFIIINCYFPVKASFTIVLGYELGLEWYWNFHIQW